MSSTRSGIHVYIHTHICMCVYIIYTHICIYLTQSVFNILKLAFILGYYILWENCFCFFFPLKKSVLKSLTLSKIYNLRI